MRVLVLISIVVAALVYVAVAAGKRHWPDPPGWWLHSSYMTCVRWAESKNGAASRNIYEIQGPNATPSYGDYEWLYDAPRAEQDYLAWLIWKSRGCHDPWGQYDGCC